MSSTERWPVPTPTVLRPGWGAVTGFVNQAELPSRRLAVDILVLPSQAGTVRPGGQRGYERAGVLPVVSDRVGCWPDLVADIEEIYPCGDVDALTAARPGPGIRVSAANCADAWPGTASG